MEDVGLDQISKVKDDRAGFFVHLGLSRPKIGQGPRWNSHGKLGSEEPAKNLFKEKVCYNPGPATFFNYYV